MLTLPCGPWVSQPLYIGDIWIVSFLLKKSQGEEAPRIPSLILYAFRLYSRKPHWPTGWLAQEVPTCGAWAKAGGGSIHHHEACVRTFPAWLRLDLIHGHRLWAWPADHLHGLSGHR